MANVFPDVWTLRRVQQYVPDGVAELEGTRIIIRDARDRTVWPLDVTTVSLTDPRALLAYLDQQVVLALLTHAQPYRLYPETVAADEMEYLDLK